MFFAGSRESIWHRLGHSFPGNATWEQARDAAGFYTVLERPVFAQGIGQALPDVKALIAGDDGRYLATVGRDYGVVQFSEVAKTVLAAAEGTGAIFNTGGLLGDNGARGWLLAELPGVSRVKGNDVMKRYALAYAGHDGRTPVTFLSTDVRVVCANTLALAMGERGGWRVTIRHTSGAETYVQQAGRALAGMVKASQKLEAWGNLAADRRMTGPEVVKVLETLHPTPQGDDSERAASRIERIESIHSKILDLYERHEFRETAGTAWALFNAAQGFAEHFAPMKLKALPAMTETAKASYIAERNLFGAGASGSADALAAVLNVTGLPHPAALQVTA